MNIPQSVLARKTGKTTSLIVLAVISLIFAIVVGLNFGTGPALATAFWGVVFGLVYGSQIEWFSRFKAFKAEMATTKKDPETLAQEWRLV